MNSWCPAITNGVVIYDNEEIRPCCVIDWSYKKSISSIADKNKFDDVVDKKDAYCKKCIDLENSNLSSVRTHYINLKNQKINEFNGIAFLDVRNSNLCNAKCRICGPHHSSKWQQEKSNKIEIRSTTIPNIDLLITDSLIEIYFAGGEPLILPDHYELLHTCIDKNISHSINLRYSTNLSTLKYKDQNLLELWKQFKSVTIFASADGTGKLYNYMRSDLDWQIFEENADRLIKNDIKFTFYFVLNNLNIWFLKDTLEYVIGKNWNYEIEIIRSPAELTLDMIPSKYVDKARAIIEECRPLMSSELNDYMLSKLINDQTDTGFANTLKRQFIYDKIRNEHLCDLLKTQGIY